MKRVEYTAHKAKFDALGEHQLLADRIAALSPEEREKRAQIKAVIHEAAIKKQEADIEAEVDDTASTFDPVAWVRERKGEIEALYV
jgi:uncharacterized protein YaiL (DUF2058 family)